MSTSCRECKFFTKLEERVENFSFMCENGKAKAGLLVGTGRVIYAKDVKAPPSPFDEVEDRDQDYRVYMTHPDFVSCEQFSPIELEEAPAEETPE